MSDKKITDKNTHKDYTWAFEYLDEQMKDMKLAGEAKDKPVRDTTAKDTKAKDNQAKDNQAKDNPAKYNTDVFKNWITIGWLQECGLKLIWI